MNALLIYPSLPLPPSPGIKLIKPQTAFGISSEPFHHSFNLYGAKWLQLEISIEINFSSCSNKLYSYQISHPSRSTEMLLHVSLVPPFLKFSNFDKLLVIIFLIAPFWWQK